MPVQGSSLGSKAFGQDAVRSLIVAYESHRDAMRFLSAAMHQSNGIALLQGPRGSGKSTIIGEQLAWLKRETPIALFDGGRASTRQLVSDMLKQYGVDVIPQHDEQMLQTLGSYLSQQTRTGQAPILLVDNADRMGSSTLSLLNWLAALDVKGRFALRIILTGKERLADLANNHSMRNLERRHPAVFSLNPLSRQETVIYLRTRMIAAGGERSEEVFSIDVCERLHELSRGWPGRLNDYALEAMARTEELKDTHSAPRVIITREGETLAEYALTKRETVIGRDEMADIVVKDRYVSKLHAMFQMYSNGLVLLDLNSTNGTIVNSVDTQKRILRNNDVISLGQHRLKIENVPAVSQTMAEKIEATDTLTLKNLDDIRRSRARHNIVAMKHK